MTNVLFYAIPISRRNCAKLALFETKIFNWMFKNGNNVRGFHVVVLDLLKYGFAFTHVGLQADV